MEGLGRNSSITEGSIWKPLLFFFFPILFGTFFQQFYSTIDTIVVGRYVGKQALAAVGVTAPIINLLVGFFTGMASGAGVVISQHFGARRPDKVNHCVHTAITLSLLAGVAFTLLGILAAPWMLRAMHTPADVLDQAVVYIQVYFIGMIPTLVYNMGAGILRSVGDSKRPLYFLILSSLLNVGLDLLFVPVLGMGVVGAALATVLSQVLAAGLVVFALCHSTDPAYAVNLRALEVDHPLLLDIIRIGLPAGLQSVLYSVSNLLIQAAINRFDTDVVAAWTVYGKMDALFWMSVSSMGLAITTFSGLNFGARQYGRIHKGLGISLGITTLITAVCVALFLTLGRPLVTLFNDDPAVVETCMSMVRFLVPTFFLYIPIENISGALRGTGDAIVPTLLTCFGVCGLRVAWIMLALPLWPLLTTVMASYPITWGLTSLFYLIYYLRGNWLRRRIALSNGTAAPLSADGEAIQ